MTTQINKSLAAERVALVERLYTLAVNALKEDRTLTVQQAAARFDVDPAVLVHTRKP